MKLGELIPFIKDPASTTIYFEDDEYGEYLHKLSPSRYENLEVVNIESFESELYIDVVKPFNEEEWVEEMFSEYAEENNAIQYGEYDGTTLVFDYRHPSRKPGWAKLKDGDQPWKRKGIAIAYARLKGYKIPKEL